MKRFLLGVLVFAVPIVALAVLSKAVLAASATGTAAPVDPSIVRWGFAAAAASTGLSAIGASYAVAVVGGAAMGVIAEKPEMVGRAIVFVGLAEGLAIYGLIIAIMILGRLQ
jgi:V/A-type H+-transporting ATPase subunit K